MRLRLSGGSALGLIFVFGTLYIAGNNAAAEHVAASADSVGLADDDDGKNWPSYGRTYSEDHASPLTSVNAGNIGRLGLDWSLELPDVHNGGTMPLEVDGVLYFTVDQSKVHAVDAVSGKLLWVYDPETWKVAGRKLRLAWGPRGIAYGQGKVYVGTTDGRLIGIDAKSGKAVWNVLTTQKDDVRAITGAPRFFDGMVVIGHGGADVGPTRGYVTAYDAGTGAQRWRFFLVPGNPADGFEDEAQAMAAKTWTGEWWKLGGGGTVWNAMTYDPEFDTIYLGAGNGAPWNQKIRSPGGGDNLFLGSVVALDARTGKYKWHYQQNPGNTWDFNAAMDMTLATLMIDGKPRKVILQAPKNGLFYVIDRTNGKLISAEPFGEVNWVSKVDLTTGRPVEIAASRYANGAAMVNPGPSGAHSWQPQAFNSTTGLVYIPTLFMPGYYTEQGLDPRTWQFAPGKTGKASVANDGTPDNIATSSLVAWNPRTQKKAWEVKTPGFWNGGAMTTAGNLVFQGQADGYLVVYAADTGKKLWSFYCGMGINGAPISYSVNGKQYVSIIAGWGGGGPAFLGPLTAQHGWMARVHTHRLLTFALDGKASLPANLPPPQFAKPVDDPAFKIDPAKAEAGAMVYGRNCLACHGIGVVAAGYAPDLRASEIPLSADVFRQVVKEGMLQERGMPQFNEFTDQELEELRTYIRQVARTASR